MVDNVICRYKKKGYQDRNNPQAVCFGFELDSVSTGRTYHSKSKIFNTTRFSDPEKDDESSNRVIIGEVC